MGIDNKKHTEIKRSAALLLNKLIHDEYVECGNLVGLLEMLRQVDDPAIEKVSMSLNVILSALNTRKTIYEHVADEFYTLRSALES